MRDFSSCTFCVHVVEAPLRIYHVLRYFFARCSCSFSPRVRFLYTSSKSLFVFIAFSVISSQVMRFCTPREKAFFYKPRSPLFPRKMFLFVFSSCTLFVHVVEVPLRIYRVLRYFFASYALLYTASRGFLRI